MAVAVTARGDEGATATATATAVVVAADHARTLAHARVVVPAHPLALAARAPALAAARDREEGRPRNPLRRRGPGLELSGGGAALHAPIPARGSARARTRAQGKIGSELRCCRRLRGRTFCCTSHAVHSALCYVVHVSPTVRFTSPSGRGRGCAVHSRAHARVVVAPPKRNHNHRHSQKT